MFDLQFLLKVIYSQSIVSIGEVAEWLKASVC